MTAAGPLVTQSTCAAKLRQMCNATGHAKSHSHALFYSFSKPPAQVVPSLDLMNRFIGDQFFENHGRCTPVDAFELQEPTIEPRR